MVTEEEMESIGQPSLLNQSAENNNEKGGWIICFLPDPFLQLCKSTPRFPSHLQAMWNALIKSLFLKPDNKIY